MSDPIVLCADTESVQHPELIGLDGENLYAQPWLRVFTSAVAARSYLQGGGSAGEVWVASSDDIDPINAAAAIKADLRQRTVRLLALDGSGSLKSRARQAGVDTDATKGEFTQRYANEKHRQKELGSAAGSAAAAPAVMPSVDVSRDEPVHEMPQRPQAVASDSRTFILPVVSGSGGAGKSTVAALSALFSQGLGYKTLLVDLDLQFGDMAALLGAADPLRIDDAVRAPERAAQLKPQGVVPALLAAPLRLEQAEAVALQVPTLLDALCGTFDVIVANTGSLWAEQHAAVLERSSKALFLVDQRPSSLRSARHAVELCSRCGIATSPFVFAVNRCAKGALYTSIDVSCALHGAPAIELRDGGRDVEELMAAGQPLDLIEARNDLCVSLEHALVDLLPGCAERDVPAREPERRTLFGRKGRRRAQRSAACLC